MTSGELGGEKIEGYCYWRFFAADYSHADETGEC